MNFRARFWILFALAQIAGLAIALIDTSPNWDDTGISVGLVFGMSLIWGAIMPKRAWIWALSIGGWVVIWNVAISGNFGSSLALLIAFIGSYTGALLGKLARQLSA